MVNLELVYSKETFAKSFLEAFRKDDNDCSSDENCALLLPFIKAVSKSLQKNGHLTIALLVLAKCRSLPDPFLNSVEVLRHKDPNHYLKLVHHIQDISNSTIYPISKIETDSERAVLNIWLQQDPVSKLVIMRAIAAPSAAAVVARNYDAATAAVTRDGSAAATLSEKDTVERTKSELLQLKNLSRCYGANRILNNMRICVRTSAAPDWINDDKPATDVTVYRSTVIAQQIAALIAMCGGYVSTCMTPQQQQTPSTAMKNIDTQQKDSDKTMEVNMKQRDVASKASTEVEGDVQGEETAESVSMMEEDDPRQKQSQKRSIQSPEVAEEACLQDKENPPKRIKSVSVQSIGKCSCWNSDTDKSSDGRMIAEGASLTDDGTSHYELVVSSSGHSRPPLGVVDVGPVVAAHDKKKLRKENTAHCWKILEKEMRTASAHKQAVEGEGWDRELSRRAWSCFRIQLLSALASTPLPLHIDHKNINTRNASFQLYNYSRICVLLSKFNGMVESGLVPPMPAAEDLSYETLQHLEEWELVWVFIEQWPEVVANLAVEIKDSVAQCEHESAGPSSDEQQPPPATAKESGKRRGFSCHAVTQFLHDLTRLWSSYYNRVQILKSLGASVPVPTHQLPELYARVILVKALRNTMDSAFALLGVTPPRQM